jgi:hypothetical protein
MVSRPPHLLGPKPCLKPHLPKTPTSILLSPDLLRMVATCQICSSLCAVCRSLWVIFGHRALRLEF